MASNIKILSFTALTGDTDTSFGAPTRRGEAFHLIEQFETSKQSAGQLERLLRLLGLEFDEVHQLLKNVPRMVDVDETDIEFLAVIAGMIGAEFNFDIPFDAQREEIKKHVHCQLWKGTKTGLEAKVESISARETTIAEFADSPFLTNTLGQGLPSDDFEIVAASATVLRIEQLAATNGIIFEIVGGGPASDAVVTVTGVGLGPYTISVAVDVGTSAAATIADAINVHTVASTLVQASIVAGLPGDALDTLVTAVELSAPIDALDSANHITLDSDDPAVVKQWLETWGFDDDLVHALLDTGPTSFNSFDRVAVILDLVAIPLSPPIVGFTSHQILFEAIAKKLNRIFPQQTPLDTTPLLVARPPREFEAF